MSVELKPIDFVRVYAQEAPRHWSVSDMEGTLDIDEECLEGLKDIEPEHIVVAIFGFHRSVEFTPRFLRQTPPHRGKETGVFSTCLPIRPNPASIAILRARSQRRDHSC